MFVFANMAETKKYLMFISYIGSAFRGSQYQKPFSTSKDCELLTVQYVFENGLKYIFRLEGERPIRINLASRTDTGVHAIRAAVSAVLPKLKSDFIKPHFLVKLLNGYFAKSENIRVLEAHIVPHSFQFSKVNISKTYLYRLGFLKEKFYGEYLRRIGPIVEAERTYLISIAKTFDLKKAQEATHLFEGVKDFGAVVGKPSKNTRPTVCNIMSCDVFESQPLFPFDPLSQRYYFYHFLCKADRFLYHMVRRMVSLTLGVGVGTLNLEDIKKLFEHPFPSSFPQKGMHSVPGFGLYLLDTSIDLETFNQKEFNEETNEISKINEEIV